MEARALLLFDGRCGLCTRSAQLIRRLDRGGRIQDAPSQHEASRERVGVTRAEADASLWLLRRDGMRLQGAAAVSAVADLLLGTDRLLGDGLLLRLHRLPGVNRLQDIAYAAVAANRHRLPGMVPWCTSRPGDCDDLPARSGPSCARDRAGAGSDIVGP